MPGEGSSESLMSLANGNVGFGLLQPASASESGGPGGPDSGCDGAKCHWQTAPCVLPRRLWGRVCGAEGGRILDFKFGLVQTMTPDHTVTAPGPSVDCRSDQLTRWAHAADGGPRGGGPAGDGPGAIMGDFFSPLDPAAQASNVHV